MDTVLNLRTQDLNHALVDEIKQQFANAQVEIRVYNIPEEAGILDEENFWKLIAQLNWATQEREKIIEPVVITLSKMPVANIYQFQDLLSEKLWALDTRAHAQAFEPEQMEEDYLSVDDFLYARCGVVANGQKYYNEVMRSPSNMPADVTFSPLLNIARKAYERKTGNKLIIPPAFNYETYSNQVGWQ
jgi:hypothetical protein